MILHLSYLLYCLLLSLSVFSVLLAIFDFGKTLYTLKIFDFAVSSQYCMPKYDKYYCCIAFLPRVILVFKIAAIAISRAYVPLFISEKRSLDRKLEQFC